MKILYLFQIDPLKSPGVFNKIASKIKSLNNFVETKAINFSKESITQSASNIEFIISGKKFIPNLEFALEKYASEYNYIVIRYPNASPKLIEILKLYPNKVVFEHNTLELNELRFNIKGLSFKDIAYLLLKGKNRLWTEYFRPYFFEKKYGAQVLSLARAGLCISNTVASFEKKKCPDYNLLVQGNGIDLSNISVLKNHLDTTTLRMLFISGSANQWHGVDRVLEGMISYKGEKPLVLHLVGRVHHSVLLQIKKVGSPHKVLFHGVLNRTEISKIAQECNLGIGSLALHRLGLVEGSTLKVREYMAMGLPFVFGYDDIDVPEEYKYALKVEANDRSIDFCLVDAFLKNLVHEGFTSSKMRVDSSKYIDQEIKMKQFVEYLEKI